MCAFKTVQVGIHHLLVAIEAEDESDICSLLAQVHKVLHRFLGSRIDHYLAAVGGMTTAVVWGLLASRGVFA